MGLTLIELREDVYDNLGMDSSDISSAKIDQYLNRSYWEITKKLKFRQTDTEVLITLTVNQDTYPISNFVSDFDAIRHMSIQDYPISGSKLWSEIVQTDYDNLMDSEADVNTSQSVPVRYARFGDKIVFSSLPVYPYQVKVRYRKSLGNILLAGPSIPEEWHETIVYGAVARAFRAQGSSMKADQASAYQFQLISTMVETETKENRDYSRSAGMMVRARYP